MDIQDDKHTDGRYCLKVAANNARLECPHLVTGTKMRKYLATTTQVITNIFVS